ncbi:MAG: hypothetical protein N2109_07590 [Fimbriimonadales bacterium]|nr:hypothetical protein [Fimbriimonadales bacterium]
MVLRVPFEGFAETARRKLPGAEAYVAPRPFGCVVTASQSGRPLVLVSFARRSPTDARRALEAEGLEVREGEWCHDGAPIEAFEERSDLHVGAVAYRSGEAMPGLWVDAFLGPRTPAEVLRAMYEEFQETGELRDATFDEFVRAAEPNVVILGPEELTRLAMRSRP